MKQILAVIFLAALALKISAAPSGQMTLTASASGLTSAPASIIIPGQPVH